MPTADNRSGPGEGAASEDHPRRHLDDTSSASPRVVLDPLPTGVGLHAALQLAGIDPASWGVRPTGPLDWDPDDEVITLDQPEPPVAIARRAVMAEQRHRDLDRQLYIGRWFVRNFGGVA